MQPNGAKATPAGVTGRRRPAGRPRVHIDATHRRYLFRLPLTWGFLNGRVQGIENVDAEALSAQRALTEALWQTLQRHECFFIARDEAVVPALLNGFPETAGWRHELSAIDNTPGGTSIKLISPPAYLTRQALLELVDVMMIAAHDSGSVFDGFEVDLSDLQRRPWWKFQ
jgi:hypothetical protein